MSISQSEISDLVFDHEDDVDTLLDMFIAEDGDQVHLHILRSHDDEAFFVSRTPITVERIMTEFPDNMLCITGTAFED